MLLDTYGLVYRAFFALPPGLTTSKGVPINAAYGFTMMLNKLIADEKPTHVIAAFDKGMPAERVAMYQRVQGAARRACPTICAVSSRWCGSILDVHRIPIVEIEGQEADDVIATLARQAEEARRADARRDRRSRSAADRRRTYDGPHDAPRNHRARTLRSGRRARALRPRAVAASGLSWPQRRSVRQSSRHSGRRRKDRDQAVTGGGLARCARRESGARRQSRSCQSSSRSTASRRACAGPSRSCAAIFRCTSTGKLAAMRAVRRRALSAVSRARIQVAARQAAGADGLPLFDEPSKSSTARYRSYVASVDPPEFVRLGRRAARARGAANASRCRRAGRYDRRERRAGDGLAFARGALAHDPVRAALARAFWRCARATSAPTMPSAAARRCARGGVDRRDFTDDAMIAAHLLDPSRSVRRS